MSSVEIGAICLKLASWNVNGLRACLKKGFSEALARIDADIVCLQETKMERGQAQIGLDGYNEYWNSALRKGYSGTAIFSKLTPVSESYGIGAGEHDGEGRVITLEFDGFYLVNVYTPNSQRELLRLEYRMRWDDAFRRYVSGLDKVKPVIICGDLNCAHQEIDIKNAKSNMRNAGFTIEERDKFSALLDAGFTDFYRRLYPDRHGAYTWWSFMPGVREKNIGWRIDYFLGSDRLAGSVADALIYPDIYGSDHCPVALLLEL
ncbi:MAG: exodeoxyribonuclease III [Oscillospiraceae bacterium]|nr:exodeoxyribonuclease III [Oscillospiraceae bacterium]